MTDAIKNQAIRMIEEQDLSGWSDAHDKVVLAALRAQPSGWIAVSERLPSPWDTVMVYPRPNDYVNEAYLNQKGVWMYSEYVSNFGDQAYPCGVTHWQPLPPAPADALEGKV